MKPLEFSSAPNSQSKIDQDYFYRLVEPIIGKVCWQIRLGYGQELCLEIGEKIPYHSPILDDEFKGEWQLGTRASEWAIYENTPRLYIKSGKDEALIKKKIAAVEEHKIQRVGILFSLFTHYYFDFGRYQLIIPDQENHEDLPLWELFMPDRQVL